ncbi:FtsK/SpoIIIE domain-containing protein [Metabacillus halosaccharovorans]|uniref:FtsK/SpoIIIE domain-containing protein n=1 Tax=Metabacillus halosaccharovorans TaxID=930124 RepID=A0ABT3DH62_9BACI|nr:FtsK/SpoIIIE domain-containing protein [Metabacillus halosaccharovorans]MCV9886223.1 FtsK/SpoIIIE domain-containing protein [Metabacillus halosaccharovorans]
MIFELTTTMFAGGLVGFSYYKMNGGPSNDHEKIVRIARNCGLVNKEGKEIRIFRKSKKNNYTEYVYQMPQGLSEKQFLDKINNFQDGLNIKKTTVEISFEDLRKINFRGDLFKQIKSILKKKKKIRKEVEIEFDGMIMFRVYNEPLPTMVPFENELIRKCTGWEVPVGEGRRGFLKHNFEKKAHIIVAGTTDFGKSNWVNVTINTLIKNKPNDVSFTLIDLKGGLEFSRYKNLKQVKGFATNVEEARDELQNAVNEMDQVTEYLLEKGFSNVKDAGFKDRHFIVIDEAADMAEDKECQRLLKDIARKGRASGLRLIYTTQYPTTETISSQVKRNCIGRLSFVLDTTTASNVVLDQGGAEQLPIIQGRALYKDIKLIEVQTPYIKNDIIKEIIQPHINIRPRKERVESNAEIGQEATKGRKYTPVIEETELS